MTPNARNSPKPLILYPHLHRNSQCYSCSTVMPGDICFNCGRLSTLLVTPRPPRNSVKHCTQASVGPVPAQTVRFHQNQPFESQTYLIDRVLAANTKYAQPRPERRTFDSQLTDIENLLDARTKLAHLHSLAADDTASFSDMASRSSYGRFSCSSRTYLKSSKTHSTCSTAKTLRSDSVAVSDILSEDGRPHANVVARWLGDTKPPGRSSATLTRRGVDCRLNLAGGRSCEWVIYL